MKLLREFIVPRLGNIPELRKIVDNIGWLFFDKFVKVCVGLFVGVWLARYLGPEEFGFLNYAITFVALFGALASFGLDSIVIRDLVQSPDDKNSILGGSFLIRLGAGSLSIILCTILSGLVHPDDAELRNAIILISSTLLVGSSSVVRNWFDSQVKAKYAVLAGDVILLLAATARVFLILAQAPLSAFLWLMVIEAFFGAIALFYVYYVKGGVIQHWCVSFTKCRKMIKDSWPLMLASVAVIIYMRIDQIMLGKMIGNESVGHYSAALRISEIWHFIPMAVVASIYPAIIEAKKSDPGLYMRRLQRLYQFMVLTALAVTIPVFAFSDELVQLLYGKKYGAAADVLQIQMLSIVFVFLGVASSNWFILEGLQRLAFYRTLFGAVVNVLLNLILIPKWGMIGAAYGTLASQFMAAYLFDALSKNTRISFLLKSRAFMPLRIVVTRGCD